MAEKTKHKPQSQSLLIQIYIFIMHFPNVIRCDIQTSKSGYFAISGLAH